MIFRALDIRCVVWKHLPHSISWAAETSVAKQLSIRPTKNAVDTEHRKRNTSFTRTTTSSYQPITRFHSCFRCCFAISSDIDWRTCDLSPDECRRFRAQFIVARTRARTHRTPFIRNLLRYRQTDTHMWVRTVVLIGRSRASWTVFACCSLCVATHNFNDKLLIL